MMPAVQILAAESTRPPVSLTRPVVLRLHVPGVGNLHAARRAEAIARLLGLELVVLKLSPTVEPLVSVLFPQRHHDEAISLGADARVHVTTTSDPASAMVGLARDSDVDLVMVGARRRPWWDLRPRPKVAERVLADAPASVLVVPLRARDPLEPIAR